MTNHHHQQQAADREPDRVPSITIETIRIIDTSPLFLVSLSVLCPLPADTRIRWNQDSSTFSNPRSNWWAPLPCLTILLLPSPFEIPTPQLPVAAASPPFRPGLIHAIARGAAACSSCCCRCRKVLSIIINFVFRHPLLAFIPFLPHSTEATL